MPRISVSHHSRTYVHTCEVIISATFRRSGTWLCRHLHVFASSKQAGTAGLDGLDLGLRPCQTLEALGQLGAVKVQSLSCLDGAKGGAGPVANEAVCGEGSRGVQRTMLLSLLSV
jgi:hypothetical protein